LKRAPHAGTERERRPGFRVVNFLTNATRDSRAIRPFIAKKRNQLQL
jgi:hypothetical protein